MTEKRFFEVVPQTIALVLVLALVIVVAFKLDGLVG